MSETADEIMRKALGDDPGWPQSSSGKTQQEPIRQIALELARLNSVIVQVGTLMAESAKVEQGRLRIEAQLLALVQAQQEASINTAAQATGGFSELTKFLGPFLERALKMDQPEVRTTPAAPVVPREHVAPSKTARLVAVPPSVKEIEDETPAQVLANAGIHIEADGE